MWISNTATTAMMVPIADAVLKQMKEKQLREAEEEKEDDGEMEVRDNDGSMHIDMGEITRNTIQEEIALTAEEQTGPTKGTG